MTLCKEHEWIDSVMSSSRNPIRIYSTSCKFCGMPKPLPEPKEIDFKIKDNLEVIEGNNWEDIWEVFKKSEIYHIRVSSFYLELLIWLKENYFAPEKKNT